MGSVNAENFADGVASIYLVNAKKTLKLGVFLK